MIDKYIIKKVKRGFTMSDEFVNDIDSITECDDFELISCSITRLIIKSLDVFFFKYHSAYEISACLVGLEICIKDRHTVFSLCRAIYCRVPHT